MGNTDVSLFSLCGREIACPIVVERLRYAGFPAYQVDRLERWDFDDGGILSSPVVLSWLVSGHLDGKWLFISSPPGSGKTFASVVLAAAVVALSTRRSGMCEAPRYVQFGTLVDRPSVGGTLMVVDDFPRDRWQDSPTRQEQARYAVDRLYGSMSKVIFLADRPIDEVKAAFSDAVREQIIGRIRERCGGFVLSGAFDNRRANV